MRALELKIPPVALVILTAALMWLVSRPAFDLLLPARRALVLGLVVAGVLISALGVVSFRRAGTTVNPIKPETAGSLVVSGIYRQTRNPMYLGFLLGLAGWAVFLSNALASVFGKDFAAYQSKVRRWL